MVLYQVCALGRRSVDRSSRWIWNFCTPFIPSRAPNPWRGTLDVPVTNWRNFALSAWSKDLKALQNHWIYRERKEQNNRNSINVTFPSWLYKLKLLTCREFTWYLWYSVFAFKSSMSILGKPETSSSNSCSLNIEISRFGIMS